MTDNIVCGAPTSRPCLNQVHSSKSQLSPIQDSILLHWVQPESMPSLRGKILNNPLYRLLFAVVAVVGIMHLLRSSWKSQSDAPRVPARPVKERKVVAHFMVRPISSWSRDVSWQIQLGNTYPYTEEDWKSTLQLAEETGLYVRPVKTADKVEMV